MSISRVATSLFAPPPFKSMCRHVDILVVYDVKVYLVTFYQGWLVEYSSKGHIYFDLHGKKSSVSAEYLYLAESMARQLKGRGRSQNFGTMDGTLVKRRS